MHDNNVRDVIITHAISVDAQIYVDTDMQKMQTNLRTSWPRHKVILGPAGHAQSALPAGKKNYCSTHNLATRVSISTRQWSHQPWQTQTAVCLCCTSIGIIISPVMCTNYINYHFFFPGNGGVWIIRNDIVIQSLSHGPIFTFNALTTINFYWRQHDQYTYSI